MNKYKKGQIAFLEYYRRLLYLKRKVMLFLWDFFFFYPTLKFDTLIHLKKIAAVTKSYLSFTLRTSPFWLITIVLLFSSSAAYCIKISG